MPSEKFSDGIFLFLPVSRGEEDEDGKDFQPAQKHDGCTKPFLRAAQYGITACRPDFAQSRAGIGDAGDNGGKGGDEFHAACHQQEAEQDGGHEVDEDKGHDGQGKAVGYAFAGYFDGADGFGMQLYHHFAQAEFEQDEGAYVFYAPAHRTRTCQYVRQKEHP